MKHILSIILNKRFYAPIIIFIVTTILYKIIKKIILNVFSRKSKIMDEKKHNTLRQLTTNIVKYFLYIIALLMILEVYNVDTKSLIASLGVFSLVVGLAVQDALKDFISGITIILENQFEVGDNVTISGFRGDVIYMGLKTTKIKSYEGEVFMIANRNITEVINHTVSNDLAIIDIPIAYEEDLDKLEKVLNNLFSRLSKTMKDLKGDITILGINSYDASSLAYRVTVPTKPGAHFAVQRTLRKEIFEELKKHDISIPYDQLVVRNG